MQVEGSVAVVFGGASGLGEATARALAFAGATVVVADFAAERAAHVAEQIGGMSTAVDVVDDGSVSAAIAAATALGELRIAVNCAGVGSTTKLLGREGPTTVDSFAAVLDVNLLGTINVLRWAAAAMARNSPTRGGERGVCVNTASIAAYEGQIGQVAYAASKAAVIGLTLPVARELASKAIRVMTIAPGLFETPMLSVLPETARDSLAASVPFPRRLGDPSEFSALVEHIVSNPMLNGGVIRLDGALRMAPR